MIDPNRLFSILVEGASFTSAAAAVVAAAIMYEITKKFGSGIIAAGFKTISIGVFLLAIGIILDAVSTYLLSSLNPVYSSFLIFLKAICFMAATYIIVIGTKKTADKLEKLTK